MLFTASKYVITLIASVVAFGAPAIAHMTDGKSPTIQYKVGDCTDRMAGLQKTDLINTGTFFFPGATDPDWVVTWNGKQVATNEILFLATDGSYRKLRVSCRHVGVRPAVINEHITCTFQHAEINSKDWKEDSQIFFLDVDLSVYKAELGDVYGWPSSPQFQVSHPPGAKGGSATCHSP